MTRIVLATLAIALVAAASGCGGNRETAATSKRTLTRLHDVSQLRQAFNDASGEPRLIVLVSPT